MADRTKAGDAIGKLIFLKLSQEDRQELFKKFDAAKPDWARVGHFTRQAITNTGAARTLSTHYVEHMAVLQRALEPHMYLGGASMCLADVVCYLALAAAMRSFDGTPQPHSVCSLPRGSCPAGMRAQVIPHHRALMQLDVSCLRAQTSASGRCALARQPEAAHVASSTACDPPGRAPPEGR